MGKIVQALGWQGVGGEHGDAVSEWQSVSASTYQGAADDARRLDAWYRRHRDDSDPTGDPALICCKWIEYPPICAKIVQHASGLELRALRAATSGRATRTKT
ncbi:hypothetical protein [Streptomyces sp. NEAU-174]|uniref:hypothetical protein n=1 Tax=Streptomyces sp. NEAU-174 TaxID=3458254 RepID=UPI004044E83A